MFSINDDCIKCGLCAELCVARIIKMGDDSFPAVPEALEARCIRCGQCVCFCPTGAAHLSFQPEAERTPVRPDDLPKAEAGEFFIRSRRSIRRFEETPLDDDLVMRILESTRFAPSASNSQLVRWIVIRQRQTLLELGLMTAEYFKNSPDGDEIRQQHLAAVAAAQEKGHDVIFRGAPQLAIAVVPRDYSFREDAAIALTYFALAAHASGVDCCWAGYFTSAVRESESLQTALKVKPDELVVGAQMFGHPRSPKLGKILPPRKKIDLTWL